MEEALAMARMAVENGLERAVLTPHLHPGRYENSLESISRAAAAFRDELARQAIPLTIGFAAEVRLSTEVLELVETEQMPYLGEREGFRVMLLEFPHGHIPVG